MSRTGGCQCGAVRFRAEGELGRANICHCRMCQKATGGPYGAFIAVPKDGLTWTRGAPSHFQSSNMVRRGFCSACGTPLTFETARSIDLNIGAFDAPADLRPVMQIGRESELPWVHALDELPGRPEAETQAADRYYAAVRSFQHPDHDTEVWPPKG